MSTNDYSLPQRAYCQIVYKNLIRCLVNVPNNPRPQQYVRELQETAKCDQFHDMREHRKALSTLINIDDKDRLGRVLEFEDSVLDGKVVDWAIRSCGKNHQEQLVKALSWTNYLLYQTTGRAERILASNFRF
eukprot:gene17693-20152_t